MHRGDRIAGMVDRHAKVLEDMSRLQVDLRLT